MTSFRKAAPLKAIALVLASLLVALLLLELAIRLVAPQELYVTGAHEWHPDGFYVNKSEGRGIQAVGPLKTQITFGPFHTRINPNFERKGENTKRVLFLGDSFTFGWLLNDNETYVSRLQEIHPGLEILNAAAGGWGTADQVRYLDLYCNNLKPDLVISVANLDDLERSLSENLYAYDKTSDLPRRVNRDLSQRTWRQKINESWIYRSIIKQSHLYRLVRGRLLNVFPVVFDPFMEGRDESVERFKEINLDATGAWPPSKVFANASVTFSGDSLAQWSPEDLYKQLFTAMKQLAGGCDAELWVVWLGWQELSADGGFTLRSLYNLNSQNFFDRQGINFFDLSASKSMNLVRKGYEVYTHAPYDSHPNRLGAMRISEAFDEVLGQQLRELVAE